MTVQSKSKVFLGVLAALALMSGCGTKDKGSQPADTTATPSTETAQRTARDTATEAQTAGEVKTYTFHGTPTKIDVANNEITIDHEKIPGYMDAMTMPYKVANPDILKQVTIGKETHFTLRVAGDRALIVKVQEAHEKGENHDTVR
jgi:Cu/Ag efflux protein CusF